MRWLALSITLGLTQTTLAHAETLSVSRGWETGATLGAYAVIGGIQLESKQIAPRDCSWCSAPSFDWSARGSLKWSAPRQAGTLSNVGVLAVPLVGVGGLWLGGRNADFWQVYDDTLLVVEASALTAVLNTASKLAFARQRPRVHALTAAERAARPFDTEDNVSFFSSHTSFAFAVATSAGSVASFRGYASAPWIWGAGLGLATSVGYLRIAADAHYLSDVLVGAAVGSAVGLAVPLLHRTASAARVALEPNLSREGGGLLLFGMF
jgi:membrane-associated phospholipid phosphatase